jgi:hypothetical protein
VMQNIHLLDFDGKHILIGALTAETDGLGEDKILGDYVSEI